MISLSAPRAARAHARGFRAAALGFSFALGFSACSSDEPSKDSTASTQTEGAGGAGGRSDSGTGTTMGTAGGGATRSSGGAGGSTGSSPNDLYACTGPGQCLLVEAARDCCQPRCGPVDISFYTAIHSDHLPDWHAGQSCAGCPAPPCSDEDKAAFTRSSTPFIAVCENSRCKVVDLGQTEVTECTGDSDCRVRYGAECCEDQLMNESSFIAISNDGALQELTCRDRFVPCGARPQPPATATARCGDGRCELVRQATDGQTTDAGSSDGGPAEGGSTNAASVDSGSTDGGS